MKRVDARRKNIFFKIRNYFIRIHSVSCINYEKKPKVAAQGECTPPQQGDMFPLHLNATPGQIFIHHRKRESRGVAQGQQDSRGAKAELRGILYYQVGMPPLNRARKASHVMPKNGKKKKYMQSWPIYYQ